MTKDLEEHQVAHVPGQLAVKGDKSRDLLTIFTDKKDVKFVSKGGKEEQSLHGRWCIECKSVFSAASISTANSCCLGTTRSL